MFTPGDQRLDRAGPAGQRRQRVVRLVRDTGGDNRMTSRAKDFGNDRGLEAGDGRPNQGADQRRARLASSRYLMRQSQEK